ncbi:MAG TPA: hypothetical protein VK186_12990 [Candidatus Deferrimicrobium sp.]|nr:hypothetical protein [Candidatus Deferrimicrobium sp.]
MTIFKSKNSLKQFLALLIISTLICPSVLSAQQKRHGDWIIITKQDGRFVEGELLKVNDNEIILMSDSESGNTIPMNEIKKIESKKKGKFLTGAIIGFTAVIVAGFIWGAHREDSEGIGPVGGALAFGALLGIPNCLLFGALSSKIVKYKAYKFQNASPQEVSKNIEKLKTMARF